MNKSLIISIAIGFAFVLAGAWVYLLIFGAPANTPAVLTNLNFLAPTERENIISSDTDRTSSLGISSTLAQLTTRKVAGFVTYTASSTPYIRYIEKGSGHIYTINLTNNQEERTSGTTITGAVGAIFSPNGDLVAITTELNEMYDIGVYEATSDAVLLYTLPAGSKNIGFSGTSTVHYTTHGEQTEGVHYQITNDETTIVFRSPFKQLTVNWSDEISHAYNPPSPYHIGGVYTIEGGGLTPTGVYGNNLTLLSQEEGFVYSYFNEATKRQSAYWKTEAQIATELPLAFIPEKCASVTKNKSWCAQDYHNPNVHDRTYLTDWYKGKVRAKDSLWLVDHAEGVASLQADLTVLTGQEIDVTGLKTNQNGNNIIFINRNNDTLWLYTNGN